MPKVLSSSTIQGIFYLSSSTSISSFCRKVVVFYTRFGLLSTFANSEQTIVYHSSKKQLLCLDTSSIGAGGLSYFSQGFRDLIALPVKIFAERLSMLEHAILLRQELPIQLIIDTLANQPPQSQ